MKFEEENCKYLVIINGLKYNKTYNWKIGINDQVRETYGNK